jgi:hypothetical protein
VPFQIIHEPYVHLHRHIYQSKNIVNICILSLQINKTYIYFCTSSEPITRINVASVRFATARAHKVLPVPGGPYNKTPLGGSIPKFTNLSG